MSHRLGEGGGGEDVGVWASEDVDESEEGVTEGVRETLWIPDNRPLKVQNSSKNWR